MKLVSSIILNRVLFQLCEPSLEHVLQFVMLSSQCVLQDFHLKSVETEVRFFYDQALEAIGLCVNISKKVNANAFHRVTLSENASSSKSFCDKSYSRERLINATCRTWIHKHDRSTEGCLGHENTVISLGFQISSWTLMFLITILSIALIFESHAFLE